MIAVAILHLLGHMPKPLLGKPMLLPSKILMTICFVLSISACSTIEGIGKDLKKGGQVIENAANNATN